MSDNPRRASQDEIDAIERHLDMPYERQEKRINKRVNSIRRRAKRRGRPVDDAKIEKLKKDNQYPVSAEEWRIAFAERGMEVKRVYFERRPKHSIYDKKTGERIRTGMKSVSSQYEEKRPDLVREIAVKAKDELIAAGVSEEDIEVMKKHGLTPRGWDLHHKLPLSGGGHPYDIDNIILIPRKPYHDDIHRHLNYQLNFWQKGQKKMLVELAVPEGMVYMPKPGCDKKRIYHDETRLETGKRVKPSAEVEYLPYMFHLAP